MGIYNRNADYPDREPNWWLDYYASTERIREPGCGKNETASQRPLDMRLKEIRIGTWKHPRLRSAEQMTVAQWKDRYFAIRYVSAELSRSRRSEQNVHDQEKRIESYVLPKLGARMLAAVTTEQVKEVIADLVRDGRLAPRTIHHVYDAMRGMFGAAAAGDPPLIGRSPCTLSAKGIDGGLPKKTRQETGLAQARDLHYWRALPTAHRRAHTDRPPHVLRVALPLRDAVW